MGLFPVDCSSLSAIETFELSDAENKLRYFGYHGADAFFSAEKIDDYRKKGSSLSEFVKEIKTYARASNR